MDARRADVPARVDQAAELCHGLAVCADMHDRDLDDAIRPRVQPSRLEIDHCEAAGADACLNDMLRRLAYLPDQMMVRRS